VIEETGKSDMGGSQEYLSGAGSDQSYDRNGLMKDVSTLITEEGINMVKVNVDVNKKNLAVFDLVLEVRDLAELSKILDRLENLPNVLEAQRVRPG